VGGGIGLTGRLEEFSSLPSAKLTVDEFREIWFQNSADPPSFAKPRAAVKAAEDDSEDEEGDGVLAIEGAETTAEISENNDPKVEASEKIADKEAEAAFLEDLVQDKELEDEIQRHLDKDQFQQALAEMAGTGLEYAYPKNSIESETDYCSSR